MKLVSVKNKERVSKDLIKCTNLLRTNYIANIKIIITIRLGNPIKAKMKMLSLKNMSVLNIQIKVYLLNIKSVMTLMLESVLAPICQTYEWCLIGLIVAAIAYYYL